MNVFIGIGSIYDTYSNGKILKFNLSILQERPCLVPCIIFDPSNAFTEQIEDLQSSGHPIWLQGKVSSYEYEHQGKTRKKFQIIAYERNITQL